MLLELALQRYALDVLLEDGFTPFVTPDVARPRDRRRTRLFSPRGAETQIYSLANADLCLIGTAEITLGGIYADSILDEEELPLKLRRASRTASAPRPGAHGRESKGLYRVHQFTKVEMFVVLPPGGIRGAARASCSRSRSASSTGLELPYRVIDIATADLGAPAYRKFDLEAWMPGRGDGGDCGEVTSTSNCTDYQARRLQGALPPRGTEKRTSSSTC